MAVRYTTTKDGIKYNFSQGQFDILSQKSFKIKKVLDWNREQQIESLISKRLFTKKDQIIRRTNLGDMIFDKILHQKSKSKSTNGSK